jgi:hypothetical protein
MDPKILSGKIALDYRTDYSRQRRLCVTSISEEVSDCQSVFTAETQRAQRVLIHFVFC